jgi:hypothetical protein
MQDDSKPSMDEVPPPPPDAIPAGGAQAALAAALEQLKAAQHRLEALAMGIARALDAAVRP